MPSGEMLVKLFEKYGQRDEEEFTKVAMEIIEEEQRKNHNLLANKLRKALISSRSEKSSYKKFNYYKNIPKDKDRGTNLVDIKYPEKNLNDILLSGDKKSKLVNIVEEYKNREVLSAYGLFPKTKILFCGPPGCGKTLSAEVLASLLGLPILYTRFDSLISSYLGETAANLRSVFDFAASGEWVLFFDEFDAIGKSRTNVDEHGELKRVVNTFLQLLDNFDSCSYVIAATNHEKMIDLALWRRFDEIIYFDKPDKVQICKYIEHKLKAFCHERLDLTNITDELEGFSYAALERLCLEAIKYCIINRIDCIDSDIFKFKIEQEIERINLIKEIST